MVCARGVPKQILLTNLLADFPEMTMAAENSIHHNIGALLNGIIKS